MLFRPMLAVKSFRWHKAIRLLLHNSLVNKPALVLLHQLPRKYLQSRLQASR